MSLAQRFERRLEGVVGSAFARVFKGQVEPVEIGNALQREAREKHAVMANGQILAPNRYRVSLGPSDFERLSPWEVQLCNSLAELVQEYLDEQEWATVGDIEVILHHDDTLHTGVFGVASRMEPEAPPRQRPYESLSLPVIPGMAPGYYEHPFGAPPAHPPAYPPAPAYAPPEHAQPPAPPAEFVLPEYAPPAGGYEQSYGQDPYAAGPAADPSSAPAPGGYDPSFAPPASPASPAPPPPVPFPPVPSPDFGAPAPAGHSPAGHAPAGHAPAGHAPAGHAAAGYDPAGYDPQAYDPAGYDPQAYDPQAYAQPAYAPPPYEQPAYEQPAYAPPPAYEPPPAYAPPPLEYGQPPAHDPGPPPYIEAPRRPVVRGVLAVDGAPDHLILRRGSNVIGRSHDCDLQVLDQGVSRRHVDVQFDGELAIAYDLGSTNGTQVNGHQIGSHHLQHGDVVKIGRTRIVYHRETG